MKRSNIVHAACGHNKTHALKWLSAMRRVRFAWVVAVTVAAATAGATTTACVAVSCAAHHLWISDRFSCSPSATVKASSIEEQEFYQIFFIWNFFFLSFFGSVWEIRRNKENIFDYKFLFFFFFSNKFRQELQRFWRVRVKNKIS